MREHTKIKVFCVDDHPMVRKGIATIINNEPDMVLVAEASTACEATQRFFEYQPDVTLMDLKLPDRSGIDALKAIRADWPHARIVMLTTFERDIEIQNALEAGAYGYLLKTMPPAELPESIRQVHNGKKYIPAKLAALLAEHLSDEPLTPRELEVLQQIAEGNRNRQIATRLFVSETTVKAHVKHIMEKLGATDRTEAIAIAARRGLVHF